MNHIRSVLVAPVTSSTSRLSLLRGRECIPYNDTPPNESHCLQTLERPRTRSAAGVHSSNASSRCFSRTRCAPMRFIHPEMSAASQEEAGIRAGQEQ
ncbi:unnamed protein product [Peniophora sp. CBMAI 1063]|nr:unnamed protein product [Peniophora sp. CBMAI 1063]